MACSGTDEDDSRHDRPHTGTEGPGQAISCSSKELPVCVKSGTGTAKSSHACDLSSRRGPRWTKSDANGAEPMVAVLRRLDEESR